MEQDNSKRRKLTDLKGLGFAPVCFPWDEEAAFSRVLEALGWSGIAEYSLWSDTTGKAESAETYQMLVVDIVNGEPRIVPAALKAVEETLEGTDEVIRERVESDLALLRERFRRIADVEEEAEKLEVSDEPDESEAAEDESQSSVEVDNEIDAAARLNKAGLFVDRLSDRGRLLNAWDRDALVQFIAGLSERPGITDRDGSVISPLEYFTRFLEGIPALVPLSELATPRAPRDSSPESLGSRIAKSIKI
ncbi:hypothetical protein GF359_04985 [candidate division WOR-3 bacterium]|uniref:Uncharacterized protein n=1 Tax=candidate division WOR-3 bacterium TaxID=2052148 RepID=A0A9D5K9E2_UNCW3|nr:hypothetical protein [candidate division WOR-3 bacterium]MBD3364550.1 hypothetical protein [candidate division WOR-3 bacterium]